MKLLARVEGQPLLERTVRSLIDADAACVAVVVAPGSDFSLVTLLTHGRVRLLENPDPSRGMFSSIQAGVAAVTDDVILVLPGDMPFVPSGVAAAVADACARSGDVVVPVYRGQRGHPIGIPGRYRPALLAAPARGSLKEAVQAFPGSIPRDLQVDSIGILRDVDVPGDLGTTG
jgi:molybdenum cofactor cytidylyltransferase